MQDVWVLVQVFHQGFERLDQVLVFLDWVRLVQVRQELDHLLQEV